MARIAPATAELALDLLAAALAYVLVFLACGGVNTRDLVRLRQARAWLAERRASTPSEPSEPLRCAE
jgi:hypothetical protein